MKMILMCLVIFAFQNSFSQESGVPVPVEDPQPEVSTPAASVEHRENKRVKRINARAKKDGVITKKEKRKIKKARLNAKAHSKKKKGNN